MNVSNKKWLVLSGAVLVQLCIGTIYSWSLFNAPLINRFGFTESEVVLTFSIATFMFAFATLFSGRLYDRLGPRFVATTGGILYGGGLILASTATSLAELYIYYGVISGIGVGFVYVAPIATCGKWFPKNKGLITGVAVGSFGLGSFIFKFIIQNLLDTTGVMPTFLTIGIIYGTFIIIGAQFLQLPEKQNDCNDNDTSNGASPKSFKTKEMVRSKSFPLVWVTYFLGCISGLFVIGVAKDIGIRLAGLDLHTAANAVALIAVFNAGGRLFWGWLTDHMSHLRVVGIMFTITIISMGTLSLIDLNLYTFFLTVAGIAFCFGGFLAVYPLITASLYGTKYMGANYGVMYQAYGIAALVGPVIVTLLGDLRKAAMMATALAILGVLVTLIMQRTSRLD